MRKAASVIIGIVVLVICSIGFYVALEAWGSSDFSVSFATCRIGLVSAFQVSPVSVENAGYQIVLMVENLGKVDALVDTIYVNDNPVTEKGLIHGESLSSKLSIGTSVPEEGVVVPVGGSVTMYLWIGNDRFTKGASIEIEVQDKDSIELLKTITLH